MEAVRIENLDFRYPLSERKALDDVSMEIQASSFVLICGKSGSGKSTLLRHFKKSLMPYGEKKGKVMLGDIDIAELDDRQSAARVGFVQQNPDNQIVTDKVWHELAFGIESLGYDSNTIRRRVAEMASFFDMQSWFRKDISELSGGQKQILNLASIMAMKPHILVLDEPTAQLDPIAASEFLRTIYRINRELGTTIIISEHRMEEIFPMADQVAVMDEGKLAYLGTPQNIGMMLHADGHPMEYGLPSVMRIYLASEDTGAVPMTIRDGRLWLEGLMKDRKLEPVKCKNAEAMEREIQVSLKDIYFRYGRKSEYVLRDLSLSVGKGEWYSILGGNATGKSTLLKVLCGILKPQSGSMAMNGSKVAMVPQNPMALFTEITVEEELLEAFSGIWMPDDEKIEKVRGMIERMKLSGLEKSHPYDLSGGEQQRLAMGKVLLLEPDILLLDEPTKGLDSFFKAELAKMLKEIGLTMIMVTHDLEFAAEHSDRCAMLFDGEIACEGRPSEFFSGNSFYTTAANQIAGRWFPEAVTCGEVMACIADMR